MHKSMAAMQYPEGILIDIPGGLYMMQISTEEQTMFTEKFSKRYAYAGETISCMVGGFKVVAKIHDDSDHDRPWENDCGHGPVSEWTRRKKEPGEKILSEARGDKRYYDFSEACKIALRDGWGVAGGILPGESKKAYAARAVERDYAVLRAYCDDDWTYCGIAVQVFYEDMELTGDYDHALWGIELNYPDSENEYLNEIAGELLESALESAKKRVRELRESLDKLV